MRRAFRRFLATCAWRISDISMTLAIRLDPDMDAPVAPEVRQSIDRTREAMLRSVENHRATDRSRAPNGHGLN